MKSPFVTVTSFFCLFAVRSPFSSSHVLLVMNETYKSINVPNYPQSSSVGATPREQVGRFSGLIALHRCARAAFSTCTHGRLPTPITPWCRIDIDYLLWTVTVFCAHAPAINRWFSLIFNLFVVCFHNLFHNPFHNPFQNPFGTPP